MSRDLMRCIDALDHAEGLCNGLDSLVTLMTSCPDGDEPKIHHVADLLGALHKDLAETIKEANRGLRKNLQ